MPEPTLIRVGKRILNLSVVRYMEVEAPNLVSVYFDLEGGRMEFIDKEAASLLALLSDRVDSDEAQVSAERAGASERGG